MFKLAIVDQLKSVPSSFTFREMPPTDHFRYSPTYSADTVPTDGNSNELLISALEDSRRLYFDQWASEWLADTKWQSSMSVITSHYRFNDIKALGRSSIRFVLQRMKNGDIELHWFPLLHDLTDRQDPVPYDGRGIVPEMADAWIKWGEDRGLV